MIQTKIRVVIYSSKAHNHTNQLNVIRCTRIKYLKENLRKRMTMNSGSGIV